MGPDPKVREHLTEVVKQAFPHEVVTDISVEEVVVDMEAREVRITLSLSTEVDPAKFAEGYFGLTGKVRKSLAAEDGYWSRFFLIITSSIGQKAHA